MFKDVFRFTLNVVVISIGLLLTYLIWEYAGEGLPYNSDFSDELSLAMIIFTALILYYINRPPKNAVNRKDLNTRLTDLSIFLYNMLIDIDKQLIKYEFLPVFDEPIQTEKERHPIISCHKIVYRFIETSPVDLSLERKDYTNFIKVLQYKENPLKEILYKIRSDSKEKAPELLEKINNTVYQLEKINQKYTYTPQTLHKELTKLFISIQEVCDYIENNYPEYDKKYWK